MLQHLLDVSSVRHHQHGQRLVVVGRLLRANQLAHVLAQVLEEHGRPLRHPGDGLPSQRGVHPGRLQPLSLVVGLRLPQELGSGPL